MTKINEDVLPLIAGGMAAAAIPLGHAAQAVHNYIKDKRDHDGDGHRDTWRVGYQNKNNPKDPK